MTHREDMEQKQKAAGEKNKTDGAKFLEESEKKRACYRQRVAIQGPQRTGSQQGPDMVTVNYRGTLIDAANTVPCSARPTSAFPLAASSGDGPEGLQ
jgi:FKBP-type peptidyl-prolyl cis-trans isomerase